MARTNYKLTGAAGAAGAPGGAAWAVVDAPLSAVPQFGQKPASSEAPL